MSLVEAFTAVFCVFMKYVVSNREVRIVRRQQLSFVFYEWIKLLHHSVLIRREEKKVSDKQIWAARFHYVESTRSNVSDWPSADNVRRERRTGEDGGDNGDNREGWSERHKETQTCGRSDDHNSDNSHNMTSSAAQSCEQRHRDARVDGETARTDIITV